MNSPDNMTLQATVEGDDSKKTSTIDYLTWSEGFAWIARILILAALVAAPWMIGSVNFWAQFWLSSALLIALALWWFETALNKKNAQVFPYLAVFLALGVLIGLLQIMPMSGAAGNAVLGRQTELYQEFSQSVAAGNDTNAVSKAQRISLNTGQTWHQIRLLIIALTAMLLSCRYFRSPRDLTTFLAVMTGNGVALSLFGLFQKYTWNGKLFWNIELQLGGTPFGPFVNRNNSAGFLLICLACAIGLMHLMMSKRKHGGPLPIVSREIPVWRQFSQYLLYFISELSAAKLASLLGIVFIAAGVIASISRGAILALMVASIMSIVSYGVAKKPKNLSLLIVPLTVAIISLTVWLGFTDDIVSRFDSIDSTQEFSEWDGRVQTWTDSWPSVAEMGKLGSGLGSYETISRLYRTDKETSVYKYAENQYFQALIEAGWPGLIIYLVAWIVAFHYSYFLLKIGQSPATVSVGIAGVFLLWSQAVASFLDFGFYIPANMLAMACVMGVIAYFAHSMAFRLKQKSWLRMHFSNNFIQVVLVGIFGACTMVSLDLNRKSRIDNLRSDRILTQTNLDDETATEKIKGLRELASNSESVVALNEMGRLWIHRTRLELFDSYSGIVKLSPSDEELAKRIWDETTLVQVQQRSEMLGHKSRLSQNEFLNQESLQAYLPVAKNCFESSLRHSPLQPEVQILLGQIACILTDIDDAGPYLERGIELAPSNAALLRQVAVIYVQASEFENAAPHMRRYLELETKSFKAMMNVTLQFMTDIGEEPDYELILMKMLPDNPRLIYQFARDYAPPESVTQKTALEMAEDLLDDVSQSEFWVKPLLGGIKYLMGDIGAAIENFESALVNNPNDQKTRSRLVDILVAEERYEDALEHANTLIRLNDKNQRYIQLADSIKSKLADQKKSEH